MHPFDDPDVIAGQGTAGLEMMEQAEAMGAMPDIVLVGASGGGLISGVSIAVKEKSPATQIYSVEPAGFDDLARSLEQRHARAQRQAVGLDLRRAAGADAGRAHLRDGQAQPGRRAVGDGRGGQGGRALSPSSELKLVLEPGGAVSLAAILAGKLPVEGKTVAAVLSGGNIDPAAVRRDHPGPAPGRLTAA